MTANKQNGDTQDSTAEQAIEIHEPVDFYEAEVSQYSANLEADPEETYQRYGFTLFHSLPAPQLVLENKKLGFYRDDAVDVYNMAGLEIGQENFSGAATLLEKALKMDDSLADAAHNLALCYEKLDRKPEALKQWKRYMELADEDEDLEPVEAHLAEIQA